VIEGQKRSSRSWALVPAVGGIGALLVLAGAIVLSGLPFGVRSQVGSGSDQTQPAESLGQVALTGLVGCWGDSPGFLPSVLTSAPANAETADSAPAAALRALIAWDKSKMTPASGWMLVYESVSETMYLQGDTSTSQFFEVTLEAGSPGPNGVGADGWRFSTSGNCELMAVPPAGYGVATWALDPSVPYSADATDLHILVTELSCHGDTPADGRMKALVEYGDAGVVVTVFVVALQGAQTCPGTPATPYVVHLDRPSGGLSVSDGGPFPARTVLPARKSGPNSTPTADMSAQPS
jgi:hypothetical protein